jgi:FdhD protein
MQASVKNVEVINSSKNRLTMPDLLAVEEPLQIKLGFGEVGSRQEIDLAVTMRTPGHDLELAAGFLFSEGIVGSMEDILHLEHCQTGLKESEIGNVVRVELKPEVAFSSKNFRRNFSSTSSCGICGLGSIESVRKNISHQFKVDSKINHEVINGLPDKLNNHQVAFNYTGGIHAAALFDFEGELTICREDIGRHNAIDKVTGAALSKGHPFEDKLLFLSGRVGFELVQKGVMAGVPIIAAVGAPSSLAVELAKETNMTLLGFVREGSFNIYCGEGRIVNG